ncbi:MAG: hypothetical protein WAW02_02030 [Sideroxyarcus sp.]
MKQFASVVLMIALCACSDGNQSTSDSKQTVISTLPVASSVIPASNVEISSAVEAASGTVTASEVDSTLSVSAVSAVAIAKAEEMAPNNNTIIKWAELDEHAKVEKTLPVQLEDGERAFVAIIERFQGRNDMYGAYLVRPSLEDANEISGSVQDIASIPNISSDSNRLIVLQTGASGGGDAGFGFSLVYFKDGEPVELHKVDYLDSSACINYPDPGSLCTQNEVNWEYEADKNDLLLHETVVSAEWKKQPSNCKVPANKVVTTYRIKNLNLSIESTQKSTATLDVHCYNVKKKKGS